MSTADGGWGGGVSSCVQANAGTCASGYPLPTWQSGFATDKSGRNLPDVSLLAGNGWYGATWGLCTDMDFDSSGNAIPDCAGTPTTGSNFNLTGVGGTSAAAPAFAGILALVAQKAGGRLGQADYELYKLAKSNYSTVFHDIATGNNSVPCTAGTPNCTLTSSGYYFLSGYNTGKGFDEASGLGSVDATQLVTNWSSVAGTATTSSLTLNGGTSALTLTHGASVTVKASVSGSGGTPTGNLALVDNIAPATLPNNDSIGLFALSGGTASGTTTYLPGGSYKVSAHYGGDSTFAQSDSNAIPVTVSAESSSTSLKVAGYVDPSTNKFATTPYYGYIYLIDAQPNGQSASVSNPDGAATGVITFKSGSATLGTAPIASDGIAELQTATLPGGADSLTAAFPGDASFLASTSSTVSFTVTPAITTLATPTVQPSSSVAAGISLTFAVTLSVDSIGAAPTGTVAFMNGSTTIGTAPMVGTAATSTAYASGQASFATTTLPVGTYSIIAVYSGDGNYAGSTSSPVSVTVVTAAQTPALKLTGTPVTVVAGATAGNTSTITVTPSGGFTGSVALTAAITSSPVGAVNAPTLSFGATTPVSITGTTAGTAALTITTTATTTPGSYTVAVTGTSGTLTASSSILVTVTASTSTPGLTLKGTALTVVAGGSTGNTSTLTVTPSGGFTGSVALTAVLTSSPAGAVNAPTLSFGATTPVSISGTTAGTATLTVTTKAATTTALAKPPLSPWLPAGGVVLAGLLLLISPSQRRRWRTLLGVVVFLAALTSGLLACGGGSSGGGGGTPTPGTTAGTYTITVTATSGTLTATTPVSLTVD